MIELMALKALMTHVSAFLVNIIVLLTKISNISQVYPVVVIIYYKHLWVLMNLFLEHEYAKAMSMMRNFNLSEKRGNSVGGFVIQMESCRIIILETTRFCIWKVRQKKFKKSMSPIFFLLFVYFTDQTKIMS